MCTMTALKTGMLTTIGAATLTAGAIAGAVIVSGMGIAAASVALIVASVALGVFTLWSTGALAFGKFSYQWDEEDKPSEFFELVRDIPCMLIEGIGELFKSCCCCKSKEKTTN